MLIFRYIIRETFKAQMAIFVVLLTIFVSQQFVQILTEASEGQIPAQLIMLVLGLQLPSLASLLLPISLFLGVLMAQGRLYADHEMAVFHACGVSEWYITRVSLVFAGVLALVTALLTLWLSPWALAQEQSIADRLRAEAGVSVLQAGRFQQAAQQRAVIFIESQSENGELSEVFVAQLPARGETAAEDVRASVVMAARGRVETLANGAQQMVLDEGRRYSQSLVNLDHQVMEFDQYQIQIREQEVASTGQREEAIPTRELLGDSSPAAAAELQWRIAIPLAMPLLILIAVPLSRVNPRQGKFARMGPALLIYLGYFMVLMATKRALADGSLPIELGLWWIHISLGIIGISLLLKERPSGYRVRAAIKGRR
ncbi:LPS export ABC transporter permease LptF [Aliidiomarina iranensis]|uniref:Lipopolysaccharide export system permease protein LptF n=1 Tax=Aliidiomarina iranensis TaxID=1434071 RepID=A0A432VUK1_9GAMM|nr:LPS export ABC transporter permease LptF [Aliidiomarina iranensis]RUO20016.1 LPS export ABC transporter permease LptF [Aliidiomarina iranensis]